MYGISLSNGLKELILSKNLTVIGEQAFYSCENLENLLIPGNIQEIKEAAFGYSNIKNLTIEEGVVSIGKKAFYRNEKLSSVIIPDSVTNIGEEAFDGCDRLTTTIGDIGGTWVKVEDESAVDASTLLNEISYDIKRAE